MSTYRVKDLFNERVVSNHRTIEAAAKAEDRFSRRVKRENGQNSYIPTRIEVREDSAGAWVAADWEEVMATRHRLNL